MSDNDDLIQRGDAIELCEEYGATGEVIADAMRTLPAVQVTVKPLEWFEVE